MKKLLVLALIATSFTVSAQTDTVNFLIVYKDTIQHPLTGRTVAAQFKGFSSLASVNDWLNIQEDGRNVPRLDSTQLVAVYDLRKVKPLKPTFTSEEKVIQRTERWRDRKWKF